MRKLIIKVFNLEKELSDVKMHIITQSILVLAIHQIFYLIVKMILYTLK
jgi:hypothetical protein